MQQAPVNPPIKPRRGYLHPLSLTWAAEALGCSTSHLSAVLKGKRKSRSMTSRYEALVREHRRNATNARTMTAAH